MINEISAGNLNRNCLSLAPVAAPTIKQIRNGTDGSLVVEWEPPPSTTLHGPLVGYRLMAHELRTSAMKEWYVRGADTRTYVLRGLPVYTKYMISVEADNNFGYSPMASQIVTTDEGGQYIFIDNDFNVFYYQLR